MHLSVLSILVLLANSASFTSIQEDASFPDYQGDREILKRVIAMSGTVARKFPKDAKCLEEILTEDHLFFMIKAIREVDLTSFGELISELSPERFDHLCFRLDHEQIGLAKLVGGYKNQQSRWKEAFEIPLDAPFTADNAFYHRQSSLEFIIFMENRPGDILTLKGRYACLERFFALGKDEAVRKMVKDIGPFTHRMSNLALDSFADHQGELLEWFKSALLDGRFHTTPHLETSVKFSVEQLQDLLKFIQANKPKYIPYLLLKTEDDEARKIVDEINLYSHNPFCLGSLPSDGFDGEPFLDHLVMAKGVNSCIPYCQHVMASLIHEYPMNIALACQIASNYGVFATLKNTMSLFKAMGPNVDTLITRQFWQWFNDLARVFGINSRMQNITQIFVIVKERLVSIPELQEKTQWSLFPVFEAMSASPGDYFPEHLIEQGREWAKSSLAKIPVDPETAGRNRNTQRYLYSFAWDKGWTELALDALRPMILGVICNVANHEFFTKARVFLENFDVNSGVGMELKGALERSVAWIALSSNHQLLDDYLDYFEPKIIVQSCKNPSLRRRISLMTHLSYKTLSYAPDGDVVNKNTAFFRDWVMYRLPSAHLADLKLLHYYFTNRATRQYPGFDVISGHRVLGLYGDYHCEYDPLRAQDLSFDPPQRGIKRSRSDSESTVQVEEVDDSDVQPPRKVARL